MQMYSGIEKLNGNPLCKNCNHPLIPCLDENGKQKHNEFDTPLWKHFYGKHKRCFCSRDFVKKNELHVYCGCGSPEKKEE